MQGNTHRVGGALSAILGVTVLGNNGMLLPEVSPFINYVLYIRLHYMVVWYLI